MPSHNDLLISLQQHQQQLEQCQLCDNMIGPPVHGLACTSKIMLIGQAPGFKEVEVLRPFAWTAGKKLFSWFADIGLDEKTFRSRAYMSAICRCYPGKKTHQSHGDRLPDAKEVQQCAQWLNAEIDLLKPELIILVGKLAINQFMPIKKLDEVVGQSHRLEFQGHSFDCIPLPHPSGASTWPVKEPGKTLLKQAMQHIRQHPAIEHIISLK